MIDATRHSAFFNPSLFGGRRVDVIGQGGLGSKIGLSCAKQGVTNLHLHDFDRVESHNVANQIYWNCQAHDRMAKLDAAKQIIMLATDIEPVLHTGEISGEQAFGDVVFLCVDRMGRGTKGPGRWDIFQAGLKNQPRTSLVVDVRMGAAEGRVYAFNPCDPAHTEAYEATLGRDEEPVAEEGVCRANPSVGPTGDIISGLALWQFFKWWNWNHALDEGALEVPPPPEFELRFHILPFPMLMPPKVLAW